MAELTHLQTHEIALAAVLHALGDPARLTILRNLLAHGEMSCAAAAGPDMPKSTQSHHFRILRNAGVIRTRRQGVYYMSRVRRADLEARFPGLLDAVARALAAEAG